MNWRIILSGFLFLLSSCNPFSKNYVEITNENYGAEVETYAKQFNLPAAYLKAVIVLESSGRKNVPPRFENKVFEKLKKVRDGKMRNLEGIAREKIKDASDEALKNLASSWGPFQVMGYKCIELDVKLEDIRSKEAIYWGVYWINKNYGDFLRNRKYEAAFRIHNTGSPTGKTHNSNYVSNGMKYMRAFEKKPQ
jgi:hypothetical protein